MIGKKIIQYIFVFVFFIGGIVFADDHGNSISSATNMGVNSSVSGRIESRLDNDYFRISVRGSGTLTIYSTGSLDTYGYLLSSSGRTISSDDDRGTGFNFRISRQVTSGTYYIRVKGFSSAVGSYGLRVSFNSNSSGGTTTSTRDDHGNSISRATSLSLNSSRLGRIERRGDNDYFRVSVRSSGILTVYSSGSLDTFGYLLNSSGGTISSDDDHGSGMNFRISRYVTSGIYYIRVRGYNNGTGSYRVGATFSSSSSGGTSTTSDDHGNSRATATRIGVNSSTAGRIERVGDYDYFRLTIIGSGRLTVSEIGSINTYGYLLDSSGRTISSGYNSRISRDVTTGTYYIKVRGYNAETGSYRLNVAFNGTRDDHGNSTSTATSVGLNTLTSGRIERRGDNDYFRVSVVGSGTLTVSSTGSLDTYGYLLSSSGRTISSDDDSGSGMNFRVSRTVSTGTYYIRVRGFGSRTTGSYSLNVSFNNTPIPTDDHGNSIATATNIDGNNSVSGRLEIRGDNDYFRLSVREAGVLTINSTGSLDTYGYLLDSSGRTISSNNNGSGINFRISRQVTVGTYYIRIRALSYSVTGSYGLNIALATIPRDDHGNSTSTATNISSRASTQGNIESAGDVDYFRIDLSSRSSLIISRISVFQPKK